MKQQEMDKKILFVIHPHSIVDVITNSSTELFIIDTETTLETIKEILQEALNLHNKTNNQSLSFNDVFQKPYIQEGVEEDVYGYGITIKEGNIVIYSADDNSIPYWIQEFLEYSFGYGCRHHLG